MIEKNESFEIKDKIINTSRKLFLEKGFDRTTIRDIASEASVNVAMVNYYFGSKDQLFEHIFQEALAVLTDRLFSSISNESFFEIIKNWVHSYYDTLLEYHYLPVFIFNEFIHNPRRITNSLHKKYLNSILDELTMRIDKEVAKGNIKNIDAMDFCMDFISLCIFPFVGKPVISSIFDFSCDEYKNFLDKRKEHVSQFIIDSIKAN